MTTDKITLELSDSEAIVLFEFVSRFTENDVLEIKHATERKILWNLCALLESKLVEPLAADYFDRLSRARAAIDAA